MSVISHCFSSDSSSQSHAEINGGYATKKTWIFLVIRKGPYLIIIPVTYPSTVLQCVPFHLPNDHKEQVPAEKMREN
jgi:hypothetical protein